MKLEFLFIFHLFLFCFSVRESRSQDFMKPTLNIVDELQKIRTMEEQMSRLQKQNEDLLKVVETLRSNSANTNSRIDELLPKIQASADKSLVTSIQSELQNVKSRIAIMEKVSDFPFFKKAGQKYYVTNGQTATFDNALTFCQSQGATLALPQNQAENLVLATLHGLLGAVYIYLGTTDGENEGTFVDMNKKPLVYANWRKNEPNNYKGAEHCVGFGSDAQWNDLPCGHACHVVCEF